MLYKTFETKNRKYYLYDTITNDIAEINKDFAENLKKNESLIYDKYTSFDEFTKNLATIKALNFFQFEKFEEIENKTYSNNYKDELAKNLSSFSIEITRACNFRCKYCFLGEDYSTTQSYSSEVMDSSRLKAIVDFIVNHSIEAKRITINFFGGEPLLDFSNLQKTVKMINKQDKPVQYSISTNGALLDKNIIEFLYKNNFKIYISLDGSKAINDRYRVDVNNEGTFTKIYDNLILFKELYSDYFKTVEFLALTAPPFKTKEIYEFFQKDILLKNNFFRVNHINPCEKNFIEKHSRKESNDDLIILQLLYDSIKQRKKDEIKSNPFFSMYKEDIERIFQRKNIERPHNVKAIFPNGMCQPILHKTFINFDGEIHICAQTTHCDSLGDVYNGIDMNKIFKSMKSFDELLTDCKSCWLARLCQNCYATALNGSKVELSAKKEFCRNAKNLFEKLFEVYLLMNEENLICKDIFK